MERIFLYGISHKSAPLEIRERFSFTGEKYKDLIGKFSTYFEEMVLLCTCNRTEIYFVSKLEENILIDILKKIMNLKDEEEKYFYFKRGENVIIHLFRVSSSLDSQIIGENEILHQVKSAYLKFKEAGFTGKYLNPLFQKSIEVGKIVRAKTKISYGNISVAKVALKMMGDLAGKRILIIGTGKVCESLINYLKFKNVEVFIIANKNYERASELAKIVSGGYGGMEDLYRKIKEVDIIITAVSSSEFILKFDDFKSLKGKNLLIFDIGCPRNVDPSIKIIEGINLFDLDDINSKIEENYNKRLKEVEKAEKIIISEFLNFLWEEKKSELEHVQAI